MSISLKQTSLPLVFHPDYTITLPKGHRFPMEKYSKILRILLNDGVVSKESIFIPKPANRNELCIAHNKDYIDAVFNNKLDSSAERLLGFKCNKTIVRRARAARLGEKFDEKEDAQMVAYAERAQEEGSLALRATGAISDDGIIDPRDTRTVLGICLSLVSGRNIEGSPGYGVYRL